MRLSDALFTTIRTAVEADPNQQKRLILYTSFGVARGRVTAEAFETANKMLDARVEHTTRVLLEPDVLELEDVTIEHYSNHLPTGFYERLFIRLTDIQGFAVDREPKN